MKRAIVFGATGGIGQEICRDLADAGWSLYLHYHSNAQGAQELAQELFAKYSKQDFMPVQLDFAVGDTELTLLKIYCQLMQQFLLKELLSMVFWVMKT